MKWAFSLPRIVLGRILVLIGTAAPLAAETASDILAGAGVAGGLVVHVGCGGGELTAALRANDRYLVHGLDTDAAAVEKARRHIRSLGLYGEVSVDRFDGKRLPYVGDLVNLLVAEDLREVTTDEVRRVLAPDGVACIKRGGKWTTTVKPRPEDIDEWTHFLHDAAGNAVADDRHVGPPKRLRWLDGPKWCRSHETPSSVSAVVSAAGRLFTIHDESVIGIYKKVPSCCRLVARDAANGVLLWKVPMRDWQPSATGTGNRWNIHHTIPRRLVAEGDRVYVTLGFLDSPVSVLDAATGKVVVEALEGTKGTDEMILSDGVLIVKITKKRSVAATARFGKDALDGTTLAAVDVKTGKQLWRKAGTRVVPYALSAGGGRVVYHDMDALVCVDARTGRECWRTPHLIQRTVGGGSTLVISDGVVLFNGHGQPAAPENRASGKKGGKKAGGRRLGGITLTALSFDDGKVLWHERGGSGWSAACTQPADLFVIDGTVWCGSFKGRDVRTGNVRKTISVGKLISPGHHYRCHRSKAASRYLILPKRGAEFVDVEGDNHMRHDWLRAPCFTGATPANGLFYVPPDQCFCYPGVKFNGYFALSADPRGKLRPTTAAGLTRGPAYGTVEDRKSETGDSGDWPMYRHDIERSGSTKASVPPKLRKAWEARLACPGSPPVVVGDRLWVAEKDAHRIRCLDTADGKDVWSFTAGGRIDSPPTVRAGLVVFGCRDGAVYCLRAADGELVWRFRAAPGPQRLVSYGQIESVWPVHGSVLVKDGMVYFAAGRSSFLDGGILVYALDAGTGAVRHTHHLEGPRPKVKTETGAPFAMEGALNDLIVSDGEDLYLQRIKYDTELNRLPAKKESPLGELDMGANHLAATGGFLDDTGFDRVYWMYSKRWPGFYFAQHSPKAGQLVVFDETTTFAVKYFYRRHQWSPLLIPGAQGYLLFADDNDNQPGFVGEGGKALDWLPEGAARDSHRRGGRGVEKGTGYVRHEPPMWKTLVPLRIRAMVQAGDRLFAAGPPDVVDPADPLGSFEGRQGALLSVFSTADGSELGSQALPSPPAFDGMIAAAGRLFITTSDGKVICMAGR